MFQLSKLTLAFCDRGGSSAGARDFAQSLLPAFRAANPHMDVLEAVRAGQHPFLRGEYLNGTSKTTSVRNMDADEVAAAAALLRGSAGRKSSVRAPARRHVPAEATRKGVQGGWRPGLAEEIMKARREA